MKFKPNTGLGEQFLVCLNNMEYLDAKSARLAYEHILNVTRENIEPFSIENALIAINRYIDCLHQNQKHGDLSQCRDPNFIIKIFDLLKKSVTTNVLLEQALDILNKLIPFHVPFDSNFPRVLNIKTLSNLLKNALVSQKAKESTLHLVVNLSFNLMKYTPEDRDEILNLLILVPFWQEENMIMQHKALHGISCIVKKASLMLPDDYHLAILNILNKFLMHENIELTNAAIKNITEILNTLIISGNNVGQSHRILMEFLLYVSASKTQEFLNNNNDDGEIKLLLQKALEAMANCLAYLPCTDERICSILLSTISQLLHSQINDDHIRHQSFRLLEFLVIKNAISLYETNAIIESNIHTPSSSNLYPHHESPNTGSSVLLINTGNFMTNRNDQNNQSNLNLNIHNSAWSINNSI